MSPIPNSRPLILRRRLSVGGIVMLSNAELMSSRCGIVDMPQFKGGLSDVEYYVMLLVMSCNWYLSYFVVSWQNFFRSVYTFR